MTIQTQKRFNRAVNKLKRVSASLIEAEPPQPEATEIARIFDADWYRQQGGENLDHYLNEGWRAGLDPGPLFSTRWYLDRYPDVVAMDVCPLLHYLVIGANQGRDPSPFFCGWWYEKVNPDISGGAQRSLMHYLSYGAAEGRAPAPLFDPQWYCSKHPDATLESAVAHYRATGWRTGCSPHPLFNIPWYQAAYPNACPGRDPVEHYLLGGWQEGHRPNPLFHPQWYQSQYPDSRWLEPLTHYIVIGHNQHYSPSLIFDREYYRQINRDLGGTVDEFRHYLDQGWREGYDPHPLFDGHWYQSQWPSDDVSLSQLPPIAHYLLFGEQHHCNPSTLFDSRWYSEELAGLADTGLDPLEHYLAHGQEDGRAAYPREPLLLPTQANVVDRSADWIIPLTDDHAGQNVVMIACHDQRRIYGLALRHMVSRYHAAGWKVVLGFDHALPETVFEGCASAERPDAVLASPHSGYDFFTWRLLWEAISQGEMPARVLMSNDSVIGPLQPLDSLTQFVQAHPAEVLGFVESREQIHHLQSWGIVFQGRPVSEGALWRYLAQANENTDKRHLIARLEARLARWAATQGYLVGSICSPVTQCEGTPNGAIVGWRRILNLGVPFVKREVFTLTPYQTRAIPTDVVREMAAFADVDVAPLIADSLAQIGVVDVAPEMANWKHS